MLVVVDWSRGTAEVEVLRVNVAELQMPLPVSAARTDDPGQALGLAEQWFHEAGGAGNPP